MANNQLDALHQDFLRAFFQREGRYFLTGGAALVGFHLGHRTDNRHPSARSNWGRSIVQQLAADLRDEFPSIGGFSASNLWRMKLFYEAYVGNEKLAPLVREIGWLHNLIILERCKDYLQREFYIRMTRKLGWTKNLLKTSEANATINRQAEKIVRRLWLAVRSFVQHELEKDKSNHGGHSSHSGGLVPA